MILDLKYRHRIENYPKYLCLKYHIIVFEYLRSIFHIFWFSLLESFGLNVSVAHWFPFFLEGIPMFPSKKSDSFNFEGISKIHSS